MQGLEEIAIIHSIDDYQAALSLKEFLKLNGFSYFTYAYNEIYDELNDLLKESNNHFDLIVYSNDVSGKFQEKFGHLTNYNINVNIAQETLWKIIRTNQNKKRQILDSVVLKNIWSQILTTVYADRNVDINESMKLIGHIIDVYCEYDLLRKLLNNTESWFTQIRTEQGAEAYQNSLLDLKKEWKEALNILEHPPQTVALREKIVGEEHFDYAVLYCKRKINEICNLLNQSIEYDSWTLLTEADKMHTKYEDDFYMAENIIAQTAIKSSEYKSLSILAIRNCTQKCHVPACNSFHFYRMGKLYEKANKNVQAEQSYEDAYRLNPLNFRALYKIAVDSLNGKYSEAARRELENILKILHVSLQKNLNSQRIIEKLPALELEYICKCLILLFEIESQKENCNYEYCDYCIKQVEYIEGMIKKNKFICSMYSDYPDYEKYLEKRLSIKSIRKKVHL